MGYHYKSCESCFRLFVVRCDTTLFCCLADIKSINIQDVIKEQLQRIHDWLIANRLKLSTTKSKYIMFHKQNKNIPLFDIHINNVNIESVQNFNFLELRTLQFRYDMEFSHK